ncbi:phosphodiesterase 4D interacting protein centrosomin isoform X2 [Musca autumnalis]|uniref:phosphodiesterase 4D interacting protein centrosomin isoform X2 n=1 Tax=Musca autumnalis TaxID=221902 RepID=UPI003CF2111D
MQRSCIIPNSNNKEEGNSSGNVNNFLEDFEKPQTSSFVWQNSLTAQDGVGYRSPCVSLQQPFQGSTSPAGQGRSVREFEEQMATLRKENFNLKLRLYFIEESIPGYQQASNSSEGQETLMKQLIDARVEMEILRKEIQEKQDLLKEAAQAMTQMEKIQKDTELKYQEMLDETKQKIQYMEMDREIEKSKGQQQQQHVNGAGAESMSDLLGRSEVAENMNALQRIRDLESLLKQSDDKLEDFQQQITKLDEILAKRDETIQEYEEKVKELVFQNAELLESVENRDLELATKERSIRGLRSANAELKSENGQLLNALKSTQDNFANEMSNIKECESQMRQQQETLTKMQTQQLKQDLQKCKMEVADKMCLVQELEDKLSNRDQLYDKARFTIQKLMLHIKNQQAEINRLKNHNSSQSTASAGNNNNNNTTNNDKENVNSAVGLSGLEVTGFCPSLSDSDAMQEMPTAQKQKYETIIHEQETVIETLKADIKKKTADLQHFVNKELWEKNREIERLNKMLNNNSHSAAAATSPKHNNSSNNNNISQDGAELQQSFSDVEYAKAVQRNKLLQRKVDILLQRLGTERNADAVIAQLRTELKQARADAEHAEKWRRQCGDLCATLSTRLEELAGFLNSLLKHKDVLGVLAVEKRKAMRRAVDRSLDLSKSLNMTLSVSGLSMLDHSLAELHNLSDILGDVEANLANETFNSHEELHAASGGSGQQLSIETLKAENKALKKELDKRRNADNKKERRSLPLSVMLENRESESEAWSEPDRKVSLARIGLEDHSASLMPPAAKEQSSIQQAETDSDYSESGQVDSRNMKSSRTQERITQLEQIIQQRDQRILEIQNQLAQADEMLKKEKMKVEEYTEELEDLKLRNKELHDDLIAIGSNEPSSVHNESMLLQQIEEKSRSLEKMQEEQERLLMESRLAEMQIHSLKDEMENMKMRHEDALQKANEQQKQQLAALRQEMEQILQESLQAKQHEMDECRKQLGDLQLHYMEAQRNIECLQENEHELKQTLVESELTARNLQKQIDESTLRASKATTERVKALNEKLQLEKRLEELHHELSAYQTERNQLQQQVQHLETEQSQLMERLAEAQRMAEEAAASAKRAAEKKADDTCQSGYTSEEVPLMMMAANGGAQTVAQQRLGEQRTQNYSPDLGIESDAGRISSAELSSAQLPLLKTVEISPNKENLNVTEEPLDSSLENIKPSNLPPNTAAGSNTSTIAGQDSLAFKKHDCAKVEQENAELRRKLLRTKRAFEDTYEKLRNANQRKAQIEKDIKNQILKTHNVLKNVRSNMENEFFC